MAFKKPATSLFDQFQPLACKASGDGRCGLYAVTHALADLCAEGKENEDKGGAGDAAITGQYANLKRHLRIKLLPEYQKTHKGATVEQFIDAFINATPVEREKEFSEYFRELLRQHVEDLNAAEYAVFYNQVKQKDTDADVTKEQYLKDLKAKPNRWLTGIELLRTLSELGVHTNIHEVDGLNIKQKTGHAHVGEPGYAGEIGLLNYPNAHWEWVAKAAAKATQHNAAHPYDLWFGRPAASNTPSSNSSMFGSGDIFKVPDQFKAAFQQFGFNDESSWGKIFGFFINIVMMMFGVVKTVTRWLNPDEQLDADDLKLPGAHAMQAAVKALGKAGEGLNQAFRGAKTAEQQVELSKEVVRRFVENNQFDDADKFLNMQQAELLNKVHASQKEAVDLAKEDEDLVNMDEIEPALHDCERTMRDLSLSKDEAIKSKASPAFKCDNFHTRLEALKEGWNMHHHFENILKDAKQVKELNEKVQVAEDKFDEIEKEIEAFEESLPIGLHALDPDVLAKSKPIADDLDNEKQKALDRILAARAEAEAFKAKTDGLAEGMDAIHSGGDSLLKMRNLYRAQKQTELDRVKEEQRAEAEKIAKQAKKAKRDKKRQEEDREAEAALRAAEDVQLGGPFADHAAFKNAAEKIEIMRKMRAGAG